MTSAIISKRLGNNVTIIEKNNNLGKKLLLTGNGRCNYFNDNMDIDNFYSSKDVSRFINENNLNKVKDFFNSLGIIPRINNGYYYPYSNTSTAIHNSLMCEIKSLGINIINEEVTDIIKRDKYTIITNESKYECDKVILATGGITYPKTGSNGFGYNLLKELGHKINVPRPALVPLTTVENVTDWKGIRMDCKVELFVNEELMGTEYGEAQLTNYGISGICVMNLSRFVNTNNKNTLVIDFLPKTNNLEELLNERNSKLKNRTIIELLESLINYKLLYFIFSKIKINPNMKWNELDNSKRELLIKNIKEYKLSINGTLDENYGETTTGGVDLDEVNDSCESKICDNLFITGELLDIDGRCGGYNLTIAWITGILAGEK